MGVNPGFGAQSFIPYTIQKIKQLRSLIMESGSAAKIEVDGGVSLQNGKEILMAGADVLVAGHAVFGADNPKETIRKYKFFLMNIPGFYRLSCICLRTIAVCFNQFV